MVRMALGIRRASLGWCESCIPCRHRRGDRNPGCSLARASVATWIAALFATFVPPVPRRRSPHATHALSGLPDPHRHHGARAPVRGGRPVGAGAVGCGRRPESPAQPHRRLRAHHAGRPHARAAVLRHRQRAGRQARGRRARGARRVDTVRHAAELQEGRGHRPAARAGGGALIRALCHLAAQPGAHAAAGARCLHNRLAQCSRREHGARPLRLRRLRRASDRLAGGAGLADPRRRRLPALRAGARRRCRHGPVRQPGAAAQHDADGGPDRHARQPDQGQRARHEQADRLVCVRT